MKLTFLGTGTSVGVPAIGCTCRTCQSKDPHDKRQRCSALIETENTRILIDTGPDFRQQVLVIRLKRRILKLKALMGDVPQVPVTAVA